MTEEEKKEFEEFLEWKKQKKEAEEKSASHSTEIVEKIPATDDTSLPVKSSDKISDAAEPSKHHDNFVNAVIIVSVIVAALIVFGITSKCSSHNSAQAYNDSTEVDTVAAYNEADSLSAYADGATTEETGWNRTEETDPMNDSKSVFVSVSSDNTNKLDFPYGDVYVTLTVRRMKKYGLDVLVKASSGQIFGNEYNGDNYVSIRFDSNKPMRFYFDEASDGSSDVVFLRKRTAFIQAAKKSHSMTVEVPFFQAGRQVFTFTTPKPLEW